jgi:hypothetical protein
MSLTILERAAVALRGVVDGVQVQQWLQAGSGEIRWRRVRRPPGIGSWWVDVIVYQYRLPEEEGEGWGVATVYFDPQGKAFYRQLQGLKIKWEKGTI